MAVVRRHDPEGHADRHPAPRVARVALVAPVSAVVDVVEGAEVVVGGEGLYAPLVDGEGQGQHLARAISTPRNVTWP